MIDLGLRIKKRGAVGTAPLNWNYRWNYFTSG